MKHITYISAFWGVVLLILSCSTQKNTFVSRSFHTLTTKYNVLFNGQQAFDKGIKEINANYKDNFRKLLPVEPIKFDEDKIVVSKFNVADTVSGGKSSINPFETAEEKAVKAIQKHSMNIRGLEHNRQIDDAYLLLGKTRYYTQRFIPAIEAFNYVIANYPYADLIDETRIWRAKTNIRLANDALAIESLKILLKQKKISEKIKYQAYTALAMGYIQTDSIGQAIKALHLAIVAKKNKEQKARNLFILGQLYNSEHKKDSANMIFTKLTSLKKVPLKYRIHAYIALRRNATKDSVVNWLIVQFKKLIKDHENKKYLDELYYHIGVLEENRDSLKITIRYFKKALQVKGGSDYQKTFVYEYLGNIHFNKGDFVTANRYYDSVLQLAKGGFKNELRIRRIGKKHKDLATLTKFETVLKTNDSILNLVQMSKAEQRQYFEDYIKKIKKADQERKQKLSTTSFGNSFAGGAFHKKNKGKWYFYNLLSIQVGKTEFQKIWGNRPLEDNWRLSDKTTIRVLSLTKKQKVEPEKAYEVATYLNRLPTEKKVIDSLKQQRNDVLYELGLIYKEEFRNTVLAIKNLERLEKLNTNKKLILPIHHNLYQLYKSVGEYSKSENQKIFITKNYPQSRSAKIIQSPNKKLKITKSIDKIEAQYKVLYYLYKKDKFAQVVSKIDSLLPTITSSDLIPKFELLRAYAIGKYKSGALYKKAMEFVALNYINTQEGKKAKEIVKQLNQKK